MPTSYNSPVNIRVRRQAALARREKDVELLKTANNDQKKLERAETDVANLYKKLGMRRD